MTPEHGQRGSGIGRAGLWLARFLDCFAALLLFALMVMTCIDVFGRYLFNSPLNGATELTRLMMAGVIFAALPVLSWREGHVTVDLMDAIFPRALVNARQAFLNAATSIAFAVIGWRVWILAARAADYGDTTEFLEIPTAPFVYVMAVLSTVTSAALALNVWRYLRGRGPLSP